MSPKRVLIVAGDVVPLPGFPTTGAGLRAWGLGKGLESRGHEVIFSIPALYLDKGRKVPDEITEHAWHIDNLGEVIQRAHPDVVVFCHWPAMRISQKLDIPTVLDFHGPHLLEREIQGFKTREANIQEKVDAIRKADFFTCAGEKQRLYFLSWLLAAGIEVANDIIASIPISLSPDLPVHEWPDGEPTFVYGGVFLPWQDPSAGLRTLIEVMEARQQGILKFFGGTHPGYADYIGNLEHFEALERELERSPRVQRMGFVSHDRLIDEYRRAHVALDVMRYNLERELAFTTRTVEYLWCGLPVVYHDYAELSGDIAEYQAGWIVDPENQAAIRHVIEEILNCPEEIRRRGQNAQQLVRECLTWDKTIEPLDAFCRKPWRCEPVATPAWHEPDVQRPEAPPVEHKGLSRLAREARYHLRYGGMRILAYYTLGFLQKRLDPFENRTPQPRPSAFLAHLIRGETARERYLRQEFEKRKPWITKFVMDGRAYGGNYDPETDPRIDWFFQAFPNAETILDLGCLEGAQAIRLAERPTVRYVLGIEGRPANLEKANLVRTLLGAGRVEFVLADLESDLPIRGQFDAVFCVGVLHDLSKPWKFMEQISQVSKKAFVQTHYAPENRANVTVNGYRGIWHQETRVKDPQSGSSPQSFWLTLDSLKEMIESCGFETIHVIEDNPDVLPGPVVTLAITASGN